MRQFTLKALIFIAPIAIFLIYNAYQNLATPITSHSFRIWEALSVFKPTYLLNSPFYPNMTASMIEEGDLAHGGKWLILKDVTWFTDSYGYRKSETGKNPKIVIIGDSFTVGTGLTQSDTITESLQQKTKLDVYPYAPQNINNYLQEERFQKNKPKVVIFESAEKLVHHIPGIIDPPKKPVFQELILPFNKNNYLLKTAVISDRLEKSNFTNTMITKVNNMLITFIITQANRLKTKPKTTPSTDSIQVIPPSEIPPPLTITPDMSKEDVMRITGLNIAKDDSMVFNRQSEEYFVPVSDTDIKDTADKIIAYRDLFNSMGVEFIFLPIPNKETIYYNLVRGGSKQDFLERLISRLKQNRVRVIDTMTAFKMSKEQNPNQLLYLSDDGHWNKLGVDITTNLVKQEIDNYQNPN